jgi:hypothetical protein
LVLDPLAPSNDASAVWRLDARPLTAIVVLEPDHVRDRQSLDPVEVCVSPTSFVIDTGTVDAIAVNPAPFAAPSLVAGVHEPRVLLVRTLRERYRVDPAEFYVPPAEIMEIEAKRLAHGHFNLIHTATSLKADVYPAGNDPLHRWALARRQEIQIASGFPNTSGDGNDGGSGDGNGTRVGVELVQTAREIGAGQVRSGRDV